MLRHPLTVVIPSSTNIVTDQPIIDSEACSREPKRVAFDATALLLAEKHETKPSALRMGGKKERIEIGSASSWKKFTLQRFGAAFDSGKTTDLNTVVGTEFHHCQEADDAFATRYQEILDASDAISKEDLNNGRDDDVADRLWRNRLSHIMFALVDILETQSQETHDRNKARKKRPPDPPKSVSNPVLRSPHSFATGPSIDSDGMSFSVSSPDFVPSSIRTPRLPSEFTTPQRKRNARVASLEDKSTESTPKKLYHPEAKVQDLQDTFVKLILVELWKGSVPIRWVTGRKMFMTYAPTSDTFFRYKYGEDGEVKDGEVRAVADGSLLLKTSKQSNPNKYCVWDRQFAALTFEAKKVDMRMVNMLEKEGTQRPEAVVQARAAQILAEMLGVVCHRGHYEEGDQKAFVVHFDGYCPSFYFADFPADYLKTIHDDNIDHLQKRPDMLMIHHTRSYNLLDTDCRTEFIKEFIALVRFIASGKANVGLLRTEGSIHRRPNLGAADSGRKEDNVLYEDVDDDVWSEEEESWSDEVEYEDG